MKRTISIATLLLMGVSGVASADLQQPDKASPTITVEGNSAIPVGEFADVTNVGLGATGTFSYPITMNIALTGRMGATFHLPNESVTFLAVPALGGVTYSLNPTSDSLYVSAEAGLTWLYFSGLGLSANEANVGGAASLGYKMGSFDFQAGVQVYDLGNADLTTNIFASIGFQLAAL